MRSRQSFFLVFLFLMPHLLHAQDDADLGYTNYHHSVQLWSSIKISKDFKHGWNANAQYVLRADLVNPSLEGHYIYAGVKYKAFKYLQPDFQFRAGLTPQKNGYRFEFGLKARYKYKDFTFSYRTAYFHEREYFARTYQHGHFPVNYWRNRIEINWDFKKDWSANISAEPYTLFDYRGVRVRKVAFIAGLDYTIQKIHTISLYYRAQPDFNSKYPDFINAIGLVYTWNVPDSFKKRKKK